MHAGSEKKNFIRKKNSLKGYCMATILTIGEYRPIADKNAANNANWRLQFCTAFRSLNGVILATGILSSNFLCWVFKCKMALLWGWYKVADL